MRRHPRGWRTIGTAAAAVLFAAAALAVAPSDVAAFDRFGPPEAEATFGESVIFEVDLVGGAPDELDLLLWFADSEITFVQPVEARGDTARHVWDAAEDYIAPNTPIRYQWRATVGDGEPVLSTEETILYDDDRPALEWQILEVGQTRVHWYGPTSLPAETLGARASDAVSRAERLFGSELGGPVDFFLYRTRDDFFGALEPTSREWVGGEARSEIRTIYASLEAGSGGYLEVLLYHEIAHMVFADAIDNPYHSPARWINEGLATWAESEDAGGARAIVQQAALDGRLVAFEAIAEQFPTSRDDVEIAYTQSATMMDDIIDEFGEEAIAEMVAAFRDGATDAEAIEAGTGVPLDELVDAWFARYGQAEPQPVEPEPLAPAEGAPLGGETPRPDAPAPPSDAPGGTPDTDGGAAPTDGAAGVPWLLPVAGVAIVGIVALGVVAIRRATEPARRGAAESAADGDR